ncbi:MAG TPA: hypothetical protein VF881_07445 [Polyangiaceae bacterium]
MAASNWLDLGIRGRTLWAGAYLLAQIGLVLTASERPDRVFGFRMFNESSTISISLGRRVRRPDGHLVTVPTDGYWQARDARGIVRDFSWHDHVTDPILATLGRPVHASYGVEAQLFRLQKALDYVASHVGYDGETRALVADVDVLRNGHDRFQRHLESSPTRE